MAVLDGIFGFPARARVAEVGAVTVGAMARFVNRAGRIAASLVTVDDSGNVASPGYADFGATADGSARASTAGSGTNQYAQFGHPSAATPALRQRADGVVTALYALVAYVVTAGGRVPLYIIANGARVNGPLGSNTGPATSCAFQVSGGFMFMPRLTTSDRDTLATAASLDSSFAGLTIYNTTAARMELWNGSAWVGLTTES